MGKFISKRHQEVVPLGFMKKMIFRTFNSIVILSSLFAKDISLTESEKSDFLFSFGNLLVC